MELVLPSVVESSSTCSRLMLTSTVDGPLQLFVRRFDCLISSKAVFGRGALLHVLVRASGYFRGRMPLETLHSSLPLVDV